MIKVSLKSAPKLASIVGAATLALVAPPPAIANEDAEEESAETEEVELTRGERRLARLLEGRVAGEPQSCIYQPRNQSLTVIDDTAYVYGLSLIHI